MKKIICILMVAAMCMAFILPAAATDIEGGTVALEESLAGTAATESGEEPVSETEDVAAAESDMETETEITSETVDAAEIIGSADSRVEAIVGLAEAMGISLEEAEALLNKMVALGDEHLGDSDIWVGIKTNILEHPETWTIVVLVVLMLVALAIFLIRGQIKNTSAQAATKANIIDIKKNEAEMRTEMRAASSKLGCIEKEHEDFKLEMDEIYEMAKVMLQIVEESKAEADKICEMAALMLSAVDLLKENSETSLNVNKEQALHTVQLLNIAMGRQLPKVSEATRKVWYEDAVEKIKTAAGVAEESRTKSSDPAPAEQ